MTALNTVDLPLQRFFWHEVPNPGGYQHICLEESDAYIWALTERFHHGRELDHRCIHLGDNSPQIFAAGKGRSSTFLMNVRCRKALGLQALGNLQTFHIYVPSRFNPSDKPSRVFATHTARNGGKVQLESGELMSELGLVPNLNSPDGDTGSGRTIASLQWVRFVIRIRRFLLRA